jgi:hypothetical protein
MEWDQLMPLALHYFTTRHPAADTPTIATAAQVLLAWTCEVHGDALVEADARYARAEAWLLAFAGGQPNGPYEGMPRTPYTNDAGEVVLPGGDKEAFTRAAVAMVEALLCAGETQAQSLAVRFLLQTPGNQAVQAAERFRRVVLGEAGDIADATACRVCGAEDLEVFYTSPTWDETLCDACFEVRTGGPEARRGGGSTPPTRYATKDRLVTLQRQLLHYLAWSVSSATTPQGVKRAQTLRRNEVRKRVRQMLALRDGRRSWYEVRLSPAQAETCEQLAGLATPEKREALWMQILEARR